MRSNSPLRMWGSTRLSGNQPAQPGGNQSPRCAVAVCAPQVVREDKAGVGQGRVTAGHQHLPHRGQLGHIDGVGHARLPVRAQRVARRHHGHQRFMALLPENLRGRRCWALKHQRQLGTARVQQLQGIVLRGWPAPPPPRQGNCATTGRKASAQSLASSSGAIASVRRCSSPACSASACWLSCCSCCASKRACGSSAWAAAVGVGSRPVRSEQLQAQLGLQLPNRHADG